MNAGKKKKRLKQEEESYVYRQLYFFGGGGIQPILVQTKMLHLTAVYVT